MSDNPASLAEIALLRSRHDETTPFLLSISETPPYDVITRTYGEIVERAQRLAAALADAGVSAGDRVACYLPNAPAWVVSSLAVWWRSAAVAAVGTLVPPPEAARLFELSGALVVVTTSSAPALATGRRMITIDEEGLLIGEVEPPPIDVVVPAADDLAVAIFTSGTTGRPKGITHTHHDVMATAWRIAAGYARNAAYRPAPAPAHLAPGVIFNPFGHMAGYSRLAFRMWIGRPTVIVPKFTVAAIRAVQARWPMDSLQLTPAMVHMLAEAQDPVDLGSLKYVTSGTAPLSPATRDRFEARYGVPVMQAYGMSETGTVAQERYEDVIAGRRGPGSVGRVAAGVEVRIRPLDDDRPAGEGEILVRTDELTAEFLGGEPVPLDEEGWFATGDVGRFVDDILYITGRAQEKIIVGGFNVYPAEVEDAARRVPGVRDAVIVGVPDDRLGEIPVAGVVWAGEPDEAALLAALREALAAYKVPRSVFSLEAVPLTPRDKVDRRRAAELARQALAPG